MRATYVWIADDAAQELAALAARSQLLLRKVDTDPESSRTAWGIYGHIRSGFQIWRKLNLAGIEYFPYLPVSFDALVLEVNLARAEAVIYCQHWPDIQQQVEAIGFELVAAKSGRVADLITVRATDGTLDPWDVQTLFQTLKNINEIK